MVRCNALLSDVQCQEVRDVLSEVHSIGSIMVALTEVLSVARYCLAAASAGPKVVFAGGTGDGLNTGTCENGYIHNGGHHALRIHITCDDGMACWLAEEKK